MNDKLNYFETHSKFFDYFDDDTINEIKNEFDFLDSLDLNDTIDTASDEHKDIYWIMEVIEDRFGDEYKGDFIFDCIDSEDFINYLKVQYNCVVKEHITYYIGRSN